MLLGTDTDNSDSPWQITVATDDFVPGDYSLLAIATAADGQTSNVASTVITVEPGL